MSQKLTGREAMLRLLNEVAAVDLSNTTKLSHLQKRVREFIKQNEVEERRIAGRNKTTVAADEKILPLLTELRLDRHMSLRQIAAYLNEKGIPSRHGKEWAFSAVKVILKRNGLDQD